MKVPAAKALNVGVSKGLPCSTEGGDDAAGGTKRKQRDENGEGAEPGGKP
jgi:hypothetical protein